MADNGAKRASVEFFQYLINSSERCAIFKRFYTRLDSYALFLKLNFLVFPSCVDDKVCVVGIFGKDNIGYKSKAVHLNGTIGKEVFKVCCFRPLGNKRSF